MLRQVSRYALAFLAGALLCGAGVYFIAHSASSKLSAELDRTKRSLDAATVALDDARRANTELNTQLSEATGENQRLGILLGDARRGASEGRRIAREANEAVGGVNLGAVGAHELAVELAGLLERLAEVFGHRADGGPGS